MELDLTIEEKQEALELCSEHLDGVWKEVLLKRMPS